MFLMPLAVAVVMALVHVLGEVFSERIERFDIELLSFGVGLMVGTFFLEILSQLAVGETHLSSFIYLPFMGGVVLIHVWEKLVCQHALGDAEMVKDVARFEVSFLKLTDFVSLSLASSIYIRIYKRSRSKHGCPSSGFSRIFP